MAQDSHDIMAAKEVDGVVHTATIMDVNGFLTFEEGVGEDGMPNLKRGGDFFEEGFADLTRVRYQERLGKVQGADGLAVGVTYGDGTRVRFVGEGRSAPLIDDEQDCVSVPMKFTSHAKPDENEKVISITGASNVAAYAMDLLDTRVPSLFATMQASRTDAELKQQVAEMIDGVQPGLYQKLNRLSYTPEGPHDFVEGLKLVAAALEDKTTGIH
ncbi:MAG TPA: hypothetical protein VMR98_05590 [Candidatus Polarisedimenticolaceae bacterium]|nr:hypothetical protein [Candidatus Polarisedimenticolaceae bacterium]